MLRYPVKVAPGRATQWCSGARPRVGTAHMRGSDGDGARGLCTEVPGGLSRGRRRGTLRVPPSNQRRSCVAIPGRLSVPPSPFFSDAWWPPQRLTSRAARRSSGPSSAADRATRWRTTAARRRALDHRRTGGSSADCADSGLTFDPVLGAVRARRESGGDPARRRWSPLPRSGRCRIVRDRAARPIVGGRSLHAGRHRLRQELCGDVSRDRRERVRDRSTAPPSIPRIRRARASTTRGSPTAPSRSRAERSSAARSTRSARPTPSPSTARARP